MKYTATCDHCKKETTIGFDEWAALNRVMLDFMALSKEQKDMILLMMDGAFYRVEQQKKIRKELQDLLAGDEK